MLPELETKRNILTQNDSLTPQHVPDLMCTEDIAFTGIEEKNDVELYQSPASTDILPLKLQNPLTEDQEATNEVKGNVFNGDRNPGVVPHISSPNKLITYEHDRLFPMPSQPQYLLYDSSNSTSDDEDQEFENPATLTHMLASQPQYNLYDQDFHNSRPKTYNSKEIEYQLSLLRRSRVHENNMTEEVARSVVPDQEVPASSPVKRAFGDHAKENTTMYPKLPGTLQYSIKYYFGVFTNTCMELYSCPC